MSELRRELATIKTDEANQLAREQRIEPDSQLTRGCLANRSEEPHDLSIRIDPDHLACTREETRPEEAMGSTIKIVRVTEACQWRSMER
jgi:hypothetical protein